MREFSVTRIRFTHTAPRAWLFTSLHVYKGWNHLTTEYHDVSTGLRVMQASESRCVTYACLLSCGSLSAYARIYARARANDDRRGRRGSHSHYLE